MTPTALPMMLEVVRIARATDLYDKG